jgi:predicted HicB family RNase H-like nuclease
VTDDMQAFSVRLPRDLHEWLRRESFETRTAMNALVAEALSEFLAHANAGHVVMSGAPEGER